jgi:Zn-finger nucleic acid-binding protein
MAVIKVRKPVQVDKIFITFNCPSCEDTFRIKMRKEVTRKNCPKCNRVTFVISITPLRGYIQMDVTTTGSDETPRDYELASTDVEFEYDENENDDPGPQEEQ